MPRVPFIEGDVSLLPNLLMDNIQAVVNSTIQADLANGNTYVLTQAWCRSALELQTRDGMVRVRFEGVQCNEMPG
jgi:hypothetical protein